MAKNGYKIAPALDRSWLDHEIPLPMGGFAPRQTPIKQLLFYAAAILIIMWTATNSFIRSAGALWLVLFIVWALAAAAYLGSVTRTKELRVGTVMPLINYAPRAARTVITRRTGSPSGFSQIAGIRSIDPDGVLHFFDGGAGRIYLVVGTASYMLFDEDRIAILDRVDAFWRKVPPMVEYIFLTTRHPQPIHHQVANLERRNLALTIHDPDLLALQDEQYDVLTDFVGGHFMSIQQYVVVRGTSPDALRQGENVLAAEVENSSLMIKEATRLSRDDAQKVLHDLYTGVDDAVLV